MVLLVNETFRLRDGVEPEEFLAADARFQTQFAYQQTGFVRRTTARDGEDWLAQWWVWDDEDRWGAILAAAQSDPAARAWAALVEADSVEIRTYTTFD